MGDLQVVTTADRHDLDDQARDALRTVWPEFIFHDPVSAEHVARVETYFPHYDVLLLDDGHVVAGGWGVPIRWDGTVTALPDGYDGSLVSAVTGHENSVPPDTLCIMAAAVSAGRQGGGLAGKTLAALRDRATAAGLRRVIAPVRPALKSRYPLTPMANFARWTRVSPRRRRRGPGGRRSSPTGPRATPHCPPMSSARWWRRCTPSAAGSRCTPSTRQAGRRRSRRRSIHWSMGCAWIRTCCR